LADCRLIVGPTEIFTDEVVEFVIKRPEKFPELLNKFGRNDRMWPTFALGKAAFFVSLKKNYEYTDSIIVTTYTSVGYVSGLLMASEFCLND